MIGAWTQDWYLRSARSHDTSRDITHGSHDHLDLRSVDFDNEIKYGSTNNNLRYSKIKKFCRARNQTNRLRCFLAIFCRFFTVLVRIVYDIDTCSIRNTRVVSMETLATIWL